MRFAIAVVVLLFSAAAHAQTPLKTGDSLQAAINAAQLGQTILLEPGAKFVGPFTLPVKQGTGVITIRSSATLPNRRITEADAHLLPTIASGTAESALRGPGAANYLLDGLRFESNVGGFGAIVELENCTNVKFDRILMVGGVDGQKRGILGNCQQFTLTRSHIANIWTPGADSQCLLAYDGAGPYTITDNYLECASENIMFGGADSSAADRVPADILIEGNTLTKRLEWRGQAKNVKNLFELKAAKRVIVRYNLLERCWTDGQDGYAIQLTVRNQDGRAPWSVVEDVTIERNLIRDVERGINVLGIDDLQPSGRTQRVIIQHNTVTTAREFFQAGGEAGAFSLVNNTVTNGGLFLKLYAGRVFPAGQSTSRPAKFALEAPIIRDNIARADGEGYSIFGDNDTPGLPSLTNFAPGFTWGTNVIVGGATWLKYPAGTLLQLPADLAQLGAQGAAGPPPPVTTPPVTPSIPTPPVDPCVSDPPPLTGIAWPTDNTGRRLLRWDTGSKRWTRIELVWPDKMIVYFPPNCRIVIERAQ